MRDKALKGVDFHMRKLQKNLLEGIISRSVGTRSDRFFYED